MLASLADIDMVVIFDDLTPLALIKALRPDVLIKGSDYALKDVVGGELVSEWGGEVFLADILAGHSVPQERLKRSRIRNPINWIDIFKASQFQECDTGE